MNCDHVPGYAPPCPTPGTHVPGTAFTGASGLPLGIVLALAVVGATLAGGFRRRRTSGG